MLAYITGSVNENLLLKIEYLLGTFPSPAFLLTADSTCDRLCRLDWSQRLTQSNDGLAESANRSARHPRPRSFGPLRRETSFLTLRDHEGPVPLAATRVIPKTPTTRAGAKARCRRGEERIECGPAIWSRPTRTNSKRNHHREWQR